ncbi:MAG: uridine kinase [Bdellovibrionales bacterium]|nr:uridine kinase [Bdellovibrionales bacterium]
MRVTAFTRQNSSSNSQCRLIGVAGGSGSGKTFFSEALVQRLNRQKSHQDFCGLIYQDNFYFDQSNRFDHDGGAVNFDHPDSIDFDLLAQCLTDLKQGKATEIPVYDFATHSRKTQTLRISPKQIVLVDGILIFHADVVRELFDDLIFFDAPEELRFSRRLARDVRDRGRTPEGVREQFFSQVKPMHDLYVQPSMRHAQTVVQDIGDYESALAKFCKEFE